MDGRAQGFDRQLDYGKGRIQPMNITMEWMARLSTAPLLGRSPAPKGEIVLKIPVSALVLSLHREVPRSLDVGTIIFQKDLVRSNAVTIACME